MTSTKAADVEVSRQNRRTQRKPTHGEGEILDPTQTEQVESTILAVPPSSGEPG